jgi:hypothetical protein
MYFEAKKKQERKKETIEVIETINGLQRLKFYSD